MKRLFVALLLVLAACRDDAPGDDAGAVDAGQTRDAGELVDAGAADAGEVTCVIAGVSHHDGDLNPGNACEVCSIADNVTGWTPRDEGTVCSGTEVCLGGVCSAKCFIDGGALDATFINPENACEVCNPAASTMRWSPIGTGTSCATGRVCEATSCVDKCSLGFELYDAGALNPSNPCEACAPSLSTMVWSPVADGASCGAGQICEAASCTDKCFLDGVALDAGAVNPLVPCQWCQPGRSTSQWSARSEIVLLDGGADVAAQGWTVVQQGSNTLTYGAGVTTLSTSTTGGTSGQLLLSRADSVSRTQPFRVRAELEVTRVDAHNQLDCAAAILGSFTAPFGVGSDRSEMICLDPAAVVWGDDTQRVPFAILGTGFHVYELSVDASNVATVTIDGSPTLTRSNFVRNGTIALGDQTNDPNYDAQLSLRSVSLVCP